MRTSGGHCSTHPRKQIYLRPFPMRAEVSRSSRPSWCHSLTPMGHWAWGACAAPDHWVQRAGSRPPHPDRHPDIPGAGQRAGLRRSSARRATSSKTSASTSNRKSNRSTTSKTSSARALRFARCWPDRDRCGPTDSTVLLHGETGTGKERIGTRHPQSQPAAARTFVRLNCAAIPSGLVESELFGHEKGAFTGARTQKRGRFELADHGSLFLDRDRRHHHGFAAETPACPAGTGV